MAYDYQEEKQRLFTPVDWGKFCAIRVSVLAAVNARGVVRLQEAISEAGG